MKKAKSGKISLLPGKLNLPLRTLDFKGPALVMAIVNCNQDSFYAPSRALREKALEKALAAERDGASIIDFGAESTRPGASYISAEEELEGLIPVIEEFRKRSCLPLSVDTRKAKVARAALDAGVDIINDISALTDDPEMASLCRESGAVVVLMHKKGDSKTMQLSPHYDNLVQELRDFFEKAVDRVRAAGISPEKIILDPGFGFAKSTQNNLEIIRRLDEIFQKDYPLLVGLSRKRFIGEICGQDKLVRAAEERLAGTLAANGALIMAGVDIIRVHDVKEHVDLAKFLYALMANG